MRCSLSFTCTERKIFLQNKCLNVNRNQSVFFLIFFPRYAANLRDYPDHPSSLADPGGFRDVLFPDVEQEVSH